MITDIDNLKNKLNLYKANTVSSDKILTKNITRILMQNILIIDNSLHFNLNKLDIILYEKNDNLNLFHIFFEKVINLVNTDNKNQIKDNNDVLIILFPNEYYYIDINNKLIPFYIRNSNYKIILALLPIYINCRFTNKNDYNYICKPIKFKNINFNSKLHIFYKNEKKI